MRELAGLGENILMVPEKGVLFIADLNWASTILYLCQRPMDRHITLYPLLQRNQYTNPSPPFHQKTAPPQIISR